MSLILGAIAAGIALGMTYTVSPVLIWAGAAAVIAFLLARRGLTRAEQRHLLYVVAGALAARVALVAVMAAAGAPLHNDLATGALTGDEAYNLSRALRARDILLDRPVSKYDHVVVHDEYGDNSYVSFLSGIQVMAGPTPYSMRLLNAVLFVAGALLLFHIARGAFGSLPAFGGLVVLLALPSLAVSSISLLKEPAYFACTALLLWGTIELVRARTPGRAAVTLAAIVMSLLLIDGLRRGALLLGISGIVLALLARVALARRWRAAASLALAALAAAIALSQPPVQWRVLGGLESAAKLHTGHVFTVGHAYKLLDAGFYVHPQSTLASTLTLTGAQAARFVLRGLTSFAVAPLPWQMASRRELAFLPELLLWYVALALAGVGVWAGWRADPLVTSMLACFPLPTAVALALTTGNVGTLLRLRGLVIPCLVWLSVLGLLTLVARATGRTNPS